MKSAIIPAIIPTSAQDLEEKLQQLQGISSDVQLDIVDGAFASPASWPYRNADATSLHDTLQFPDTFHVEMDLMVHDAQRDLSRWIAAGANRIVLHAEGQYALTAVLADREAWFGHDRELTPRPLSVGLAIGTNTDVTLIEPFLDRVDYAQFMGIKSIGKQGQPFDDSVLPRIRAFRRAHPDIPVQVDGGVTMHTAPALISAGVSRLVVGSALWKAPDLEAAYAELAALAQ